MFSTLDGFGQDFRFALRQLRKTPQFALIAIVTLALGIGANTAVFSVMDAVLMRNLPVRDPQQLVYLHTSDFPGGQTGYGDTSMRMQVFEALRGQKRVFSDLMGWAPLAVGKVPVRIGTHPEEAIGNEVSGNFFSGLGVSAIRGRMFTDEDERNHSATVVLNYRYWMSRFGGENKALGQTLFVKGVPFTIIGVTDPRFAGLDPGNTTDFWVPFQIDNNLRPWGTAPTNPNGKLYGDRWWFLLTVGRLQPNVSWTQALGSLQPVFQAAAQEGLTAQDKGDKPPVLSFTDTRGIAGVRESYEQPLRVLMGMVALVLVIACANVSLLLVARNLSRQREFSLRMALGGSRIRLFRQLLTESLLIVAGGVLLAWFFAAWATQALAAWSQIDQSLQPNATVLLFTLAVSAAAAVVFGLAPLRSAMKVPIGLALKTSNVTASTGSKQRSGQVVVTLQMALCLVLLIGAGLLVRTLRNLEHLNLGLQPEGILVFGVAPQNAASNEANVQFFDNVLQQMRALPGVTGGTLARQRPGAGWSSNTTAYVDGQKPNVSGWPNVRWNSVGPDFLTVMRIPVKLGRDINQSDTGSSPRVCVVNETFVKKYLPNTTPIGHTLSLSNRSDSDLAHPLTIVGVMADSKYTAVREDPLPIAYVPYTQVASFSNRMEVLLRTQGEPMALLPQARKVMDGVAPDLPLLQPSSEDVVFSDGLSNERMFARLAGFFGALSVLLVATGLYGTLAYKVTRRTPEIGIRMALGAQRTQVLWMILRESLLLCAAGVVIGAPLVYAGSTVLRSMLFGLQPGDPGTIAMALLGMLLIALFAGFLPARRASSVDPMIALRSE